MINDYDTTVLIPCNDRRIHGINWAIKNLENYGYTGTIFLADRGEKPIDLKMIIAEKVKIKHHHFGANLTFYDRLIKSTQLIDTKYVTLHPDDDIMFFDVIKEGIEVLERDSSYCFAHGKSIRLQKNGNKIQVSAYQFLPLDQEDGFIRLTSLCSSFNQHFWGTMRVADMQTKALEVKKYFDHDVMFNQYYDSVVTALLGKVFVSNKIGLVRFIDHNNGGVQLGAHGNNDHFPWLIMADDFGLKYKKFRDATYNFLGRDLRGKSKEYFDISMISIIRWGLCQIRKSNVDGITLRKRLAVPSEAKKLNFAQLVFLDRYKTVDQKTHIQEKWG